MKKSHDTIGGNSPWQARPKHWQGRTACGPRRCPSSPSAASAPGQGDRFSGPVAPTRRTFRNQKNDQQTSIPNMQGTENLLLHIVSFLQDPECLLDVDVCEQSGRHYLQRSIVGG